MCKHSEVSSFHRFSLLKKHVGEKSVNVSVSFLFKGNPQFLTLKSTIKTHFKPEDKTRVEPGNKKMSQPFQKQISKDHITHHKEKKKGN